MDPFQVLNEEEKKVGVCVSSSQIVHRKNQLTNTLYILPFNCKLYKLDGFVMQVQDF